MIKKIISNFKLLHLVLLSLVLAYAYSNKFVQDDAYISFQYAKNYAEGIGMVFNAGDRVEGYTNFLWTAFLGTAIENGVKPEDASLFFGLLSIALVYLIFHFLSREILKSKMVILFASMSLFLNYSFSCYVTGGLETQMQLILILFTFYLITVIEKGRFNFPLFLTVGCLFSALVLNRMDSALFVGLFGLYLAFKILSSQKNAKHKAFLIGCLIIPFVSFVSIWLVWKFQFYGDILPNTFYTKIGAKPDIVKSALRGIAFVTFFGVAYFLFPFFLATTFYTSILERLSSIKFTLNSYAVLTIVLILYNIYFIYVGGDFMEFRFQIPFLPFYIMGFYWIMQSHRLIYLVPFLFLANSLLYSMTFRGAVSGFESIPYLRYHIEGESSDWKGIGEKLKTCFGGSNLKIAVSPAGAIPYFSGLHSIDMLGLNDAWISKNGLKYKNTPGHYKITSLKYLDDQNVNIVIGHPMLVKNSELPQMTSQLDSSIFLTLLPILTTSELLNQKHDILEIPINGDFTLLCWYLNTDDTIEKSIESGRIRRHKVSL